MKRSLLAVILGISFATTTTRGTGFIYFANYGDPVSNPLSWASQPELAPPGLAGQPVTDPNVQIQLYWALGSFGDLNSFLAAAHPGIFATLINFIPGYEGDYGTGIAQVLDNWTDGPVTFMVRAWETAGPFGGPTFESSSLRGQSALWEEVAAADPFSYGIQDSLPGGSFAMGPPEMSLSLVPEPMAPSLVILGLSGLNMMIRRRRM